MSTSSERSKRTIRFVDTTIRDGQTSLWALNMRTSHMAPIMPALDSMGYVGMELMAPGASFKKMARELGENPWDFVHAALDGAPNTNLRWHGTFQGASMSGYITPEVGEMMMRHVAAIGIRYIRTGDNWNRFRTVIAERKAQLDSYGVTPILHVMYSESPRHTDEYFVERARDAAALNPHRLVLKDVGGLLTPDRVRQLVPKLLAASPGIEWEFHGHCSNGFGPINAIEAVHAGMNVVHTSMPPLANGSSQPSVATIAENLAEAGYGVDIDLQRLPEVESHLREVARREGFPVGVPVEFHARLYRHQVPGGMISNLKHQLARAGIADRLDETLDETGRVREDYGWPIMVTPLSQFVGTQAAINVITGTRYEQVTDESIEYALGMHGGDEATEAMDPDVRHKILDRPRTEEILRRSTEIPTLDELRARLPSGLSTEDFVLMAICGSDILDVIANHPGRRATSADRPLTHLVRELLQADKPRLVHIEKDGLALTVQRRATATSTTDDQRS